MGMIRQQFSTGKGFDLESVAIRLFQHSWCPFTHVDIILPDGSLLGARSDGGVQIRASNYEDWAHTCHVELPCDDAVEAAYLAFAKAQVGKPYDFAAIAHMTLLNANPDLPAPARDWRDRTAWFCDELDLAAKEVSGYFKYPLAAPANILTPADDLLIASRDCDVFPLMKLTLDGIKANPVAHAAYRGAPSL